MHEHIRDRILKLPHLPVYDDNNVTINKFVSDRRAEFFKEIEDRIWLYLDVNHWLGMRDALRSDNSSVYLEFYENLKSSVNAGNAICLITDIIYFELMSQSDQESRKLTAKLMTELTKSFIITGLYELEPVLTRNSLASIFQLNQFIYPMERILINKAPSILGVGLPTFKDPALADMENMIRKKGFDAINQLSFSEMLEFGDQTGYSLKQQMASTVDYLNSNKHMHDQYRDDFEKIFRAESAGIVDLLVDRTMETNLLKDILNVYPLTKDMMKNALAYSIHERRDTVSHLAPDIILAKLHAGVHFDKKMKYTANHLNDFKHSMYALSYCDIFFTDGPFQRRITQSPLKLHEEYEARVYSDPQDLQKALATV